MPNSIWVDVEDLFQYAAFNPRPSGIQRIEYELCRALVSLPETRQRVRFVRHANASNSFYAVSYHQIETLYDGLVRAQPQAAPRPAGPPPVPEPLPEGAFERSRLRRIAYRIPPGLRTPMVSFYKAEREAGTALRQIGRELAWGLAARLQAQRRPATRPDAGGVPAEPPAGAEPGGRDTAALIPAGRDTLDHDNFDRDCRPGDLLLVLGSPWFHPFYADMIAKAQRQRGVRFALLVYDLIPLRRPEWCDHNLALRFREWTGKVFPLVDNFLTISRASAQDITHLARKGGYTLRAEPQPIPIGTGFSALGGEADETATLRPERLPEPGSYVLIVSTIEARKNHILLFRIWRRLLEEMPPGQVPTLVFAGRVGWLVSDLMQQLRNADFLDGKIQLIKDPTDLDLRHLYSGCRFTLFPSLYEGWGLPVTESLSFGKPCVISRSTSLPEAGGTLARYFDPEDGNEAYAVIRDLIEHPEQVAAWTERVRREFRPVSWEESARGMLDVLGIHPARAADAPVLAHPA